MLPEENPGQVVGEAVPSEVAEPTPVTWSAPPARRNQGRLWLMAVLGLLAILAGSSYLGWNVGWHLAHPVQLAPVTNSSTSILDVQGLATKVDPAIVDIETVTGLGKAAGTGMILTSTGEILTNNHVIEGSTSIQVMIAGRLPLAATVIGTDPTADVALLQVQEVSHLPTVKLAKTSVKVGDAVLALGNAYGLGGTPSASTGTVIALNQDITANAPGAPVENLVGLIQANASISPGDSGGPLVNAKGEVVGMITAGSGTATTMTASIDYAISAVNVLRVVNLIHSGVVSAEIVRFQVGYMGVAVSDLSASGASALGVSGGALIVNVIAGGPAAKAGIGVGMVITEVQGVSVSGKTTLGPAIRSHAPGEKVSVVVVTASGTNTVQVTLGGVNA